jgi:enoyl-CoA hydratase
MLESERRERDERRVMSSRSYEGLTIVVEDGVAIVTMLFQGQDLQVAAAQHKELSEVWADMDADPDVRAVLITGVGDSEFYLSGRPDAAPAPGDAGEAMWDFASTVETEVAGIVREMIRFSKPVVAAVNGAAAGAGMAVAMLADVSIMAEDAWMVDPHIMLGIAAGDGPCAIMPLLTGLTKAKLYMLTSDALDGYEAERIGLVSKVVARPDLVDVAMDYARRFAASPPVALRFTKRVLNQWLRLSELVAQDTALALEALSADSGERAGNPHTAWPPRVVAGRPER